MQQSGGGGLLGGLGRTMAEGVAWGTGTAIAREAVHGVMGAFSGGEKPQAAPQQQVILPSS